MSEETKLSSCHLCFPKLLTSLDVPEKQPQAAEASGAGNDPGPRSAQTVRVHQRRDVETREGSVPGDRKRRQRPRHLALPSILLPMSCPCWAFSCFNHLSCFLPETASLRPRAHTLVPHICAHTTPAHRRAHAHTCTLSQTHTPASMPSHTHITLTPAHAQLPPARMPSHTHITLTPA